MAWSEHKIQMALSGGECWRIHYVSDTADITKRARFEAEWRRRYAEAVERRWYRTRRSLEAELLHYERYGEIPHWFSE